MRAFISYSHRDAEILGRLHVHLAALRREGRIETWFDREILAGDELDEQIAAELERADLFLLLISPDFIASDYCMDREMMRAMQRHEAGDARVVPIIVEPCDWGSIGSIRRLKALPKDGHPISEWTNTNTALLNVVQGLRRVIDTEMTQAAAMPQPPMAAAENPMPRYRVQRDFDAIDRAEFRETAFEFIKSYFRKAIEEINSIDGLRGKFFEIRKSSFGATVVNKSRHRGVAHITVHMSSDKFALSDIYFCFAENSPPNTSNGGFNVSCDEYEQFLVEAMSMFGNDKEPLSAEKAGQRLWSRFIEQAGIEHA